MASNKPSDVLTADSNPHEISLFKCRMAENAERFQDMLDFIKEACENTTDPLEPAERNYLSVAYKNCITSRRTALRCLTSMKAKFRAKNATKNVEVLDEFYAKVLKELEDICHDVLHLIGNVVLRTEVVDKLEDTRATREFQVFFSKMAADYYRYWAEFAEGSKKTEVVNKAAEYYKKAIDHACNGPDEVILHAAHPIRLGLYLNYSVFLYEIEEKTEEAKKLSNTAFTEALERIGTAEDLEYKDSSVILQLLRDNTTLWCAQDGEAQEVPKAE